MVVVNFLTSIGFLVNLLICLPTGFCFASDQMNDFSEYEISGEIVFSSVLVPDSPSEQLANQRFLLQMRGSEWRIELVNKMRSTDASMIVDDEVWYGDGRIVIKHERLTGNRSDEVSILSGGAPVSTTSASTIPILWTILASRGMFREADQGYFQLLHDWRASPIVGGSIYLECIRQYNSKMSSFPERVVYLLDRISAEQEEGFSKTTKDGSDQVAVYKTSLDKDRTNAVYQVYFKNAASGGSIPIGFQFRDWSKPGWGFSSQLQRQGDVTIQSFTPKCSLKDLKPQIRRETVVGDRRLWVESPPVFQEGQGYEIPTYTLMPGEDWPTVEEAKFRLKHPDRRTKPQPWGFVLVGAIVGVPLLWAARRYSRKA